MQLIISIKDYVFPFLKLLKGKIGSITVSMSMNQVCYQSVLKAIADKTEVS